MALSEWDDTPWAGTAPSDGVRLRSGTSIRPYKATYGDAWLTAYQQDIPLSMFQPDPQSKAARLLQAYKVGWFNKAERKISTDFASLNVTVMPENQAGDNQTAIVEPDLLTPWDQLDPVERFLRLMEKPNPYQTGRALRQQTMIRWDMAGWTWWYTELGSDGLPVENGLYGISPSRLWPSYDDTGKLIGYVMDKDRRGGGVPFEVNEIIPFSYTSADDGPYGVGVVEAIWAQVPLTDLMAKHTSDILTTGGRLAGSMWPKNRALDEAEFQDAKRVWRTVVSDPNAARRLLIFPEPMEWSQGSATPDQIGIPELATLNRDDILTSFPISPYQLGVPMPGGLNSAATRKEDRHDYWQGTIHPRVELFEETIQTYLMSKYEAVVGYTLDFEVEEPNLDDAAVLVEKVAALDALTSAGFDEQEAIDAVDLEHIKFVGKPAPVPPPQLAVSENPAQGQVRQSNSVPVEAQSAPPTKSVRTETRRDLAPEMARAYDRLTRFFTDQRRRVEKAWRELPPTKAARKASTPDWWDAEYEDEQLTSTMRGIYVEVGRAGLQTVADQLDRFIKKGFTQAILNDLLEYGGRRIKNINERTLQALTLQLAEGTRRGYSINQLIEGVPDENYGGLMGVTLDNGTPAFDELRAETIARTETMLSYNRATVDGYDQFGVTTLLAYDGDQDEECAARDGQEFSIEEAQGIEDHPNGTLVWSPVVDKSVDMDRLTRLLEEVVELKGLMIQPAAAPIFNLTMPQYPNVEAPIVNIAAPELPTPVVNVTSGEVKLEPTIKLDPTIVVDMSDLEIEVPPAQVTVNVPKAELKATVKAEMPSEMRITSMPDRVTKRSVSRNDKGHIVETTDVETDA